MNLDDSLESVQEMIGYRFDDISLLGTALTHSSFASENMVESYERLEFLGDAVIELAVTSEIFNLLADSPEGEMTRIRATVVDETTLASVARRLGLPIAVKLGVGEERSGGRDRSSILSDVVESVVGAVYLDGGFAEASVVVLRLLTDVLTDRLSSSEISDPRSSLQELLAVTGRTVSFKYDRSGPDHEVLYTARAFVDGVEVGVGRGSSKKSSAIDAARGVLESGI